MLDFPVASRPAPVRVIELEVVIPPPTQAIASRRSFLLALALVMASASPGQGQTRLGLAEAPGYGRWTAAVDSARAALVAQMEAQGIPGASVAVAVDDSVVWTEGFGWADVENKVPVRPTSKFRIASISKSVTAAAVGRLYEEGRLDLDAPVQRYVPGFPVKAKGVVTTRLLAGHLAGMRHYRGDEFANRKHYDDVVDALEIFENDTLLTAPGEKYAYSTYGWNLISAVVQGASGEPFLQYMYETVIGPLALHETVAEWADSIIPGRVRQYVRDDDGRLLNATWVDNSNKWAGGGYLSTASDLVRYASAYLGDDFLKPSTVQHDVDVAEEQRR